MGLVGETRLVRLPKAFVLERLAEHVLQAGYCLKCRSLLLSRGSESSVLFGS